jgi:hypothetical protein
MGDGGDFDTVRPYEFVKASVEIGSGSDAYEIPIDILNHEQYSEIQSKNLLSSIPTKLFATGSNPLETLKLWPVPSEANNLILETKKVFTAFSTINDDVELPPGYSHALRYNLAIVLAPEYGKTVGPEIIMMATDSKENIKRANNYEPVYLTSDLATRKKFNILTGE